MFYNHRPSSKPRVGMIASFTVPAVSELAGIPATIIAVWPRFRSGDYLVTLEYAQPIKVGKALVQHMDAFVSELEVSAALKSCGTDTSAKVRQAGFA